jgi:hypothetical protein
MTDFFVISDASRPQPLDRMKRREEERREGGREEGETTEPLNK